MSCDTSNSGAMAEIKKIFNRFDKNGDGKISFSELKQVLEALGSDSSPEELKATMQVIDTDGDRVIDLKEFAAFYNHTSSGQNDPSREIKDAFDLYDADKNGLISANELHSVLKKLGEKCSLKDCSAMIRSVDADGDGHVNFEEFKEMMKVKL